MKPLLRTGGALGMGLTGFIVLVSIGATANPVVFVAAVLMALLPVPLYLALSLWIDRFEPEPRNMVIFTFLWGATVAVFIALVLNTIGEAVVGSALGGTAAEIYGGSISAPVVEESAKALALLIVFRRRREEFNGVVDGIVYALLVGLGFAMTENVLYYAEGAAEQGAPGALATFFARGILSPFAHPLFTAMTGIGLGLAAHSRHGTVRFLAPLAGLGAAMALHAIWNTAAATGYAPIVYALLFLPLFAGVIALMVVARAREGRLIRRHLEPELRSNLLVPAEVELLGSVRERRRVLKRAPTPDARRALRGLYEAATELAFHRDRTARGLTVDTAVDHDERFLDALRSLRAQTGGQAVV